MDWITYFKDAKDEPFINALSSDWSGALPFTRILNKQRAEASNYQFCYALNKQATIAEAFGATHTPHICLFNSDMEQVYLGAIDDNAASAKEVEKPYLKNAIKQLEKGKNLPIKHRSRWAVQSSGWNSTICLLN